MNVCPNCSSLTENPKFCNRSCSASYNNRKSPKRKASGRNLCPSCGDKKHPRSATCSSCRSKEEFERLSKMTLLESLNLDGHKKSTYNTVRYHSRRIASTFPLTCLACGFNSIVHVCHIRAVSSFSPETLVAEINRLDNLTVLCPNHHWELDHGLLEVGSIPTLADLQQSP